MRGDIGEYLAAGKVDADVVSVLGEFLDLAHNVKLLLLSQFVGPARRV